MNAVGILGASGGAAEGIARAIAAVITAARRDPEVARAARQHVNALALKDELRVALRRHARLSSRAEALGLVALDAERRGRRIRAAELRIAERRLQALARRELLAIATIIPPEALARAEAAAASVEAFLEAP